MSHSNRLVHEKSPYLLQHAHNPVDWYPWGEEAFARARAEDKPVFLSIGYSTCHWCHVMARESFADEEIAALLNERFISIKVDREERPDVDAIYMQACQAMTGTGGWPLTVFLTPDKEPFFAGTYFPPESRYGRPGFREILTRLYDEYKRDPGKIARIGQQVVDVLQPRVSRPGELREADVHYCYRQLQQAYDSRYGGFGAAPKFPVPHNLMFLLRYHRWTGNAHALAMVTETLTAMADGGIYDHLGYGFARYSTDERWLAPHFEKMLYDNALLAIVYTEAWQVTGEPRFMTIAQEILDYVARVLTAPQGGYYSAEDADSEGEEGKFYLWDKAEVMETLGPELGPLFCAAYNISQQGNFQGRNIPNRIGIDWEQLANRHNLPLDQLKIRLEEGRRKLFAARAERVRPHRDDKILTAWNALMIAAQALAARAFGRRDYLDRARTAFAFIQKELRSDGRLLARWRQGEARYKGYLDDHAFLLWACHELYSASLDPAYLKEARELARAMEELFWDEEAGGYFFTGSDGEALIVRTKEVYDGALPSGNGVAARELLRLARLTGEPGYEERANQVLAAFAYQVRDYPAGHTQLMQAALLALAPGKEVVVLGDRRDEAAAKVLKTLQRSFLPEVSWLAARDPQDLAEVAPFAAALKAQAGTSIHICRDFACSRPETDADRALEQILG